MDHLGCKNQLEEPFKYKKGGRKVLTIIITIFSHNPNLNSLLVL